MNKKSFIIISILIAFISCKKENDRPQWDVRVVAPLFHATLGVNDLITDSLISSDSQNALHLFYEESLNNNIFNFDSLFSIPDTTILTVLTMPFLSFVLMPNTPFYSSNQNLTLSISGVELRGATIKSGFLKLEIRNRLAARIIYTYTLPGATLNNIPFQFSITMDAAPSGGYTSAIQYFDMSGYEIELTGASGNDFNSMSYNVTARTDTGQSSINVFQGDTMVNVRAGLIDISPYYAKGYLGQTEITEDSISSETNIFGFVRSGIIKLEEATMTITLENFIGVDAQAFFMHLESINSQNNSVVPMVAPTIINRSININRASETGIVTNPVNSTFSTVQFNNSNSNLRALIENFPDYLSYGLRLKVNPLGNISGSNDFAYSDYLVNGKLKIDIPLAFAANQLAIADTARFIIEDKENFDLVGAGTFTLVAENGFPFDATMQLILLDEQFQAIDSIVLSRTIAAADVDASFIVVAPKKTIIPIDVDETKKNKILSASNLSIKASFTTPAFPQSYQIYSSYKMDVKLIADAPYKIR